jgi:calcineurin-like phosphoesterase family protein
METLIIHDYNKLYFTSDTHFGHANILVYCSRPFKDQYHMDEVMIQNWNNTVSNEDIIIHAGDFCWGGKGEWIHLLHRLNGIKILVQGNHDRDKDIPTDMFFRIEQGFLNMEVKDEKPQRITVCHFPMLSWLQSHKGAWNLFGHWHSGTVHKPEGNGPDDLEVYDYVKNEEVAYSKLRPSQYDVGVDANSFTPISYNQIKKIMYERKRTDKG